MTESRMPPVRLILLGLAACTAAGCRSDADTRAEPLTDEVTWSAVEELRIGSRDDPDDGFSSIAALVFGDDGLLYVLEGQERQVRVFDGDGTRIRVFGRRGAGPGELEAPYDLGIVGDTVWITESPRGNRRVTLFRRDGTLLATFAAPGIRHTGRTGRLWVDVIPAALQPGGILTSTYMYTAGGAAGDTVVFPLVRFDLHGQVVDTVGWDTVGVGSGRRPQLSVGQVTAPVPERPSLFDDGPIRAADGRVVVERPLARAAESSTFVVTLRSGNGDTTWRRAFTYRPVRPSQRQVDAVIAAAGHVFRSRGADSVAVDRAVRSTLDLPAYLPPVTRARLVGDEVWLRREDTGGPWRWLVLGPDGQPLGTFELPRPVRPSIFTPDVVWGVSVDELDVPWIVRYRIRAPGRPRS
jgi:hypothetical protein